jgi:hypothetical protein
VRPRTGGDSPELEFGGDNLRGLWWGFYRRYGRDGGLGSSCRGRRDQRKNRGCNHLAGASRACRGANSTRGRGMSPRGGFLRG